MVFLFLIFIQATALTCYMSCLDLCSENPSESCINECCPGISLATEADCELKCEENEGVYECTEECTDTEYTCQDNCNDFCDSRADNCYETCTTVFCKHNSENKTNWTFIIGLILLASVFVIVLYSRIMYINNKVFREESEILI